MSINVIQTRYAGILFRSRLEARWAVFFDAIGMTWEYEMEGYNLDGIRYLPDFWLPDFKGGIFVECKPVSLNEIENQKADRLVFGTCKTLLKAVGTPRNREYEFLYYDICSGVGGTDFYHEYLSDHFSLEFYKAAVSAALTERFNHE